MSRATKLVSVVWLLAKKRFAWSQVRVSGFMPNRFSIRFIRAFMAELVSRRFFARLTMSDELSGCPRPNRSDSSAVVDAVYRRQR